MFLKIYLFFTNSSFAQGVGNSCPSETYAIADLTQHAWILPNYPMPQEIEPLGYRPHIIRLQEIPGHRNVLFLSGWASSDTGSAVSSRA